ncbi:retrovirus-related pol polyprotein from transposon TNT 1-94 [Tanacetum coccineum]
MRADGKSQMYMFFSQMLKSFDREDLKDLYKLVKAKYESTKPVEDLDLLLWGDVKTMFKPHVEDAIYRNQQGYKVLNWKLYDSCRVHSLKMQHMQIYMLVEKKYPLALLALSMMLEKKLNIDYESEMAYQLLKLIIKQLKNEVQAQIRRIFLDGYGVLDVRIRFLHISLFKLQNANNARLVAQGYNQQEGIDLDETYAPVARLEPIRILLAYACAHDFKLYQMDVKSDFLNGFINEEVYVAQPPGFIDFEKPNHVFKLKKALYGLKQAPKAWYDRLKAFLLDYTYTMGLVDHTLFTNKKDSHIIIVQIYVDDIIFGSTCQDLCDDFSKIMHDEFEMSMMGELNFFHGLQIKQLEDGIFFNQSKYVKEMLKKLGLEDSKPIKTPMSTKTKLTRDEDGESIDDTKYRGMIEAPKTSHLEAVNRIFRYIKGTTHLGLWYPKGTGVETTVYADSDHAGDYVD